MSFLSDHSFAYELACFAVGMLVLFVLYQVCTARSSAAATSTPAPATLSVTPAKSAAPKSKVGYEDPATLPFGLPASLDDINAAFMTKLLRHRGLIGAGDSVVSQEEKGVGMTAGYFSAIKKITVKLSAGAPKSCPTKFVAKAWPSFELLPKDAIAGMFIADIRGFADHGDEFYPRPEVFLASYDESKNLYAMIVDDCDEFATHATHETPLTLAQVKMMIPKLVDIAVKYEGCDEPSHPLNKRCGYVKPFVSEDTLNLYQTVMAQGAPLFDEVTSGNGHGAKKNGKKMFEDDPKPKDQWGSPCEDLHLWTDRGLGADFSQLFTRALKPYMAGAGKAAGATVTISHGDLRGDNLFFSDKLEHGWLAIDHQLTFFGPVPSDLAYLMCSSSVQPGVYKNHTDEIIKEFYTQFMKKTTKYKNYTLEQCTKEFALMTSVLYIYYVGMGAAIWMAGATDQPMGSAELVGSGAVKYSDLSPAECRKRMWWRASMNNFSFMFEKFGVRKQLEACKKADIDFKAAFDYTAPRGPPPADK